MAVLFFLFILAPITGILLIACLWTSDRIYLKIAGYLWLGLLCLFIIGTCLRKLTDIKVLKKSDYYGTYIINRDYFPGRQADWQYENYRFEIKENDSIYFYITNKEKIVKTYKGIISTVNHTESERLIIKIDQPTHHILNSNPTIYRSAWSFKLVFYSTKFNNVCFKKGNWKPL